MRILTLMLCLSMMFVSSSGVAHQCESVELDLFDAGKRSKALESGLYQLFSCLPNQSADASKQNDLTACNWFVGQALDDVWGYEGFRKGDRFMTTDELARSSDEFLKESGWENLGSAGDQDVLTRGEKLARGKHPVIAFKPGHIALILPGGVVQSGGWSLKVPMAAQLRISDIDSAFVGCRLSWSFRSNDKAEVNLYYHPSITHSL